MGTKAERANLKLVTMKKMLRCMLLALLLIGPFMAQSQIRPFVTTWTTTTDPESISIPLNGSFTYDFTFVWKNAADSSEVISGTHTSADGEFVTELPNAGNYLLEISGNFPHFRGYPKASLVDVNQWGDIVWGSMFQTFNGWQGVEFSAEDNPNLSQVTNMAQMFFRARSFNDNINDWDVSNVTDMGVLFREAFDFNQPLDKWNVGNVTQMAVMFENANSFNQNLNSWNTGNVTNMSRMFNGADNFNGDISNWDVSNVTVMERMFESARAFNGDLSSWNVSSVRNMNNMFRFTNVFNGNIDNWNVSNVTSMGSMFQGAVVFNRDISRWNVENVNNISGMFAEARVFNQDISSWNVSAVTNMLRLFRSADAFNQDISGWDVSNVTNMFEMFLNADAIDQDLGAWDISSVANMQNMFNGTALSPQNYDQTIIGWATKVNENTPDVTLGASGLTFCKAASARQLLIDNGWTINDANTQVCSSETDIISFKIPDAQIGEEVIDAVNHTITLSILSSADITNLTPSIELSPGATIVPDPINTENFSNPVIFTITAEDEVAIQDWTITVTQEIAPQTDTDILTFVLAEDSPGLDQVNAISLDDVTHTVTLDLIPFGSLTTIVPEISFSQGATSNLSTGESIDLSTGSAIITITAEDGTTTQDWTIETNVLPSGESDILEFEVTDQVGASVIDPVNHTISFVYSSGLDFTALSPVITVSEGATVNPASEVQQDFSNPVIYTVTAQDGSTVQEWTANLIPASSETDILSFIIPIGTTGVEQVNDVKINSGLHTITINLKPFASLTTIFPAIRVSEGASVSPESTQEIDISSGSFIYTVTAEDGITTQEWTINTNVLPSKETDILAFTIPGQIGETDINTADHEVTITYPFALGLSDLTPEIEISLEATIDPLSGTTRDFTLSGTNSVEYTVTAQDGATTQVWTVTLVPASSETEILAFELDEESAEAELVVNTEINTTDHIITLNLEPFSEFSTIIAFTDLSPGATISPADGEETDISSGSATYTVTAEDGITTQDWEITTNVLPSTATDFISFKVPGQIGESFIDSNDKRITVFFATGTNVTSLTPSFEVSRAATVVPGSGETQNFSTDVVYTVTAQDGVTTQEWTVSTIVQRPFITAWNSNGGNLAINLNAGENYNFNFIWKNSNGQIVTFGQHDSNDGAFITDLPAGLFTLEILGTFPHFTGYPKDQLLDVNQWGDIIWNSMRESFRNWTGTDFSATDIPDLSQGPDMFRAFSDNPNFNANIGDWDMSQVTTLQGLFNTCPNFNSDISQWDVSNVTNMESTFINSGFNGDISSWNTSSVTRMVNTFRDAVNFDQDLSSLDFSNVNNMSDMLTNSGMSVQHYDKLLISLATQDVRNNVTLGANGLNSCLGSDAKDQLIDLNDWTIQDDGQQCSSENDIVAFDISDSQVGEAVIDITNHTVTATVLNSAELTELVPEITISADASIIPGSGIAQDYSNPVVYQVIASDSTSQNWTVTVTKAANPSDETDILSFNSQSNQVEETKINTENHTISLKLISGGSVTSITPELTISQGASIAPAYGEAIDLSTGSATYIVTAEDQTTTQDWTVSVILNDNTDISAFELTGVFSSVKINNDSHTIDINVAEGTSLASLLTEVTIPNGATITPQAISIQDFTAPVTYTITAEDGITAQEWIVSVLPVRPFISRWQPEIDEDEEDDAFIFLGLDDNFDYDFSYQWKDENGVVIESGSLTTDDEELFSGFPDNNEVTLEIIGDFPYLTDYDEPTLLDVIQWGDIEWRSFESTFRGWPGEAFSAEDTPDLSQVTSMRTMFRLARSFNGDVSDWDVSNVTDIAGVFNEASSFAGDVSQWQVDNVTDMQGAFNGTQFNGDLSNWNVGNVTNMINMFLNASLFDQDLSNWNIGQVTNMSGMLSGSGMSTQNYDKFLLSIAAQTVQPNVTLAATGIGHCFGASAIETLVTDDGWTINDDGAVCSSENDILTIDIPGLEVGTEVIDAVAHTAEVTVINSADLSALSPIFTLSDGAIFSLTSPQSGQATDFTNPVEYEILSSDSTFQTWSVNVVNASTPLNETDILTFVAGTGSNVNIDSDSHEITFDALITSEFLVSPVFTLSQGASSSPASGEEVDLSDGTETYSVTAEDGTTTQDWTVTVNDLRPINDLCSNAIEVSVNEVITGSSTFATSDASIAPNCGSNNTGIGVWYRIVGNGETITLNTCSPNSFSDTSLSVFTGSCEDGLTCFAGNEDAGIAGECGGAGFQSRLNFNSEVGVEYLILVDGFANAVGGFELTITSESTPELPLNDDCETAEALTVFAQGEGTPSNGNNTNAALFTGQVSCDVFGSVNDVWYTFNSGPNTRVEIRLNGEDTDGEGPLNAASGFRLAAYEECGGNSIICDTNADELTIISVTPDTDYWLQVWNDDLEDEGTFTIIANNGPNTAANLSFENAVTGVVSSTITISRSIGEGTIIDSLIAEDAEGHAQITSLISGNEEGIFAYNDITRQITIADASALLASAETTFDLLFLAEDQGPGELTSEVTLTVNIVDNSAPIFNVTTFTADENTSNGSIIGTLIVSDPDGDAISIVEFNSPSGAFSINPLTRDLSVADVSKLDFETRNSFTLEVTIADNNVASLQSTGVITINLNDVNEAPVVATASFSISDQSINGTVVGTVSFEEEDNGQSHSYAITDTDAVNIFSVNSSTGEISVANAVLLAGNGTNTYNLTVTVTDDGNPALSGSNSITIEAITNNAPFIETNTLSVNENSLSGVLVGSIQASDADGDLVTLSLLANAFSNNFILTQDGQLFVRNGAMLDFESTPQLDLRIAATDNGIGNIQTVKTVTIELIDVNEAPQLQNRSFDIISSVTAGTIVGTLQGTDPENDQLNYSITDGNQDGVFDLNSGTGVLTVADPASIDPIAIPVYNLTISVSDGEFTNEAQVTIDVFANPDVPVFISSNVFTIDENNQPEALIGTVIATDGDGISSYDIISGDDEGLFEIDDETGVLRADFETRFNFEETKQYILEVRAEDDGIGNVSSIQQITININDVNEFDPVISNATGIVAENSETGTSVVAIEATDADIFQTLSYEIIAGNDAGLFAIDANGEITTAGTIDFEINESFNLTVAVSDDVDPVRTTTKEVIVTISNVNEAPVLESIADQDGSVGSEIAFTIRAVDPENDDLTFSFSGGAQISGMVINATNGAFTWTPDASQFGSFATTIEVTDGEFTDSETIAFNILNSANDILSFELSEQTGEAVINTEEHTVEIEVAFGTNLASLTPVFTISEEAVSSIESGTLVDFTNPVTISITAQNGNNQDWVIIANEAPSNETDILTFALAEQTSSAIINSIAHTVEIEVVFGTDLSNLVPAFTISEGAESNPASGTTIDFTGSEINPVTITVTGEDRSATQEWLITVTEDGEEPDTDTDILTFALAEQKSPAVINTINHTVEIEVEFGTDITALTPVFTLSEGATSNPVNGSTIDFTDPATISVTAEDGTTIQDWTVTVTLGQEPLSGTDIISFTLAEQTGAAIINAVEHTVEIEVVFGTDLSNLVPAFSISEGATSNPASGTTISFTNPVTIIVTAEDGTEQNWIVTVIEDGEEPDTDTDMLTFEVAQQTRDAIINAADHTVEVEVASGTDVTNLTPAFTLSEGASSNPASGETVDFTTPVTYTVTAEDGITTQDWIVTVSAVIELSSENDMLTFTLAEQTTDAIIDADNHTIEVEVVAGTDLSSLVPTFTLSDGAISDPESGIAVNFSSAFTYVITAENGEIQNWLITVTEEEIPTSVAEDIKLEIFPVPATDVLSIRAAKVLKVSMFDLNGRQVTSQQSGNELNIDISDLVIGTYILILEQDDQIIRRKIIKH